MYHFVKRVVVPLLTKRGWIRVCEIGASYGASTELLASLPNLALTVVDPCLDCDLQHKYEANNRVTVMRGISLEMLPRLGDSFDCILIDGDHNWYTVYNELQLICKRNLLHKGGIVFFHDVGWPYGRRDMYYQPALIPEEYRQPYEQKGMVRHQTGLLERGGFNTDYLNATHEGGPKNGVLTAIEDFVLEHPAEYRFFRLQEQFGFGVMYRRNGLHGDLGFLQLKCACALYKGVATSKRFTWTHFPSALHLAKSLLRRGKPSVQSVS